MRKTAYWLGITLCAFIVMIIRNEKNRDVLTLGIKNILVQIKDNIKTTDIIILFASVAIVYCIEYAIRYIFRKINEANEIEIQKSFDVFELQKSASFDDVKAKYKVMIKLFHPDKHSTDDEVKKYTDNKTIELNNAFNTLKTKHFKVI